jgi:hypothetical protein
MVVFLGLIIAYAENKNNPRDLSLAFPFERGIIKG